MRAWGFRQWNNNERRGLLLGSWKSCNNFCNVGFVRGEEGENEYEEDEEDEQDEGINQKKKKQRKRDTVKNFELDDDDYELLADNIPGFHRQSNKLKRLKKAVRDTEKGVGRPPEDISAEKERPDIPRDNDMDDFIVDEEEDDEVDRPPTRRRKKKTLKHFSGISSEAFAEAQDIFGDVDELLQLRKQGLAMIDHLNDFRRGRKLEDEYGPSVLLENYLTEKDDIIRNIDMPGGIQSLNIANSEREVDDVDLKFKLHFSPCEVGVDERKFKRPKKTSLYSICSDAGLREVAGKFGPNSKQFGLQMNLEKKMNLEGWKDPEESPDEMALNFTCAQFGTPEAAFRGVKWLRDKPLSKFKDAQWLLIQKAEEEKLLQVTIKLQDGILSKLIEEANFCYLSDRPVKSAPLWNEQRKLILPDSSSKFLFPSMEKEVRNFFTARAKNWVAMEYGKKLWSRVSAAPYRCKGGHGGSDDGTAAKVMACCWGPENHATTFVMLDSSGEVLDVLFAGYLNPHSGQQRRKNDQQRLLKFMTDHQPHVVVMGAANMSCTKLQEDIFEMIRKLSSLVGWGSSVAGVFLEESNFRGIISDVEQGIRVAGIVIAKAMTKFKDLVHKRMSKEGENEYEEDEEDEQDEGINQKKKKQRKRDTVKNFELDDDDYELLADNIPGFHRQRRRKKKTLKHFSGISSEAFAEAQDIFGDVDELLQLRKQGLAMIDHLNDFRRGRKLEDEYGPSVLLENYLTEKDDIIRNIDMPGGIQSLNIANSEREVDDVDLKFKLHFSPCEVGVDERKFKRPKKTSLYSICSDAGLREVAGKFGPNSKQFGLQMNLEKKMNLEGWKDPEESPDEMALNFTCAQFGTPEAAFRGVKWLRDKPLSKFKDAQWLLIQKAEEEKLLQVTIKLQDGILSKLIEEANFCYLSDRPVKSAPLWNEQRKLILPDSSSKFLFPSMEKEVRNFFTARAKNWVAMEYGKKLWSRVSAAPYRCKGGHGGSDDGTAAKVMACCWGPENHATTFVMLDSSGEVLDVLFAGYLNPHSGQQRRKNDQQRLLKFMTDHQPHVVVMGAANMSCTKLQEDIFEVYRYTNLSCMFGPLELLIP
ncbi:hypothetical protein RJ640_016350 [Escallonia rubra]|uniref:Spt6 acidic N-terminal domain-containing protein n=1 Tax=Escallonia rubra TaxID=112253 RepID=A0AA88RRN0_9ASTE|nr:hypothetical protein RJ640_016350 [Escallonia rubra]